MSDATILLVEDNADDELLTQRALRKNNFSNPVVVARDGVEALDRLLGPAASGGQEAEPLPQLVLLDLKLPRLDGLEVLRRLRAHPRTHLLPVVVRTSSTTDRDLEAAYEAGANSYVRKPVDFGAFVETARQLGFYWLLINEPPPAAGGR